MSTTRDGTPPAATRRAADPTYTAPRVRLAALGADLTAVIAFAAAGRQSHEPGSAIGTVLTIAWPFAVGALVAHAALRARGVNPLSLTAGLITLGSTYVIGMALRGLSGRGLDPAFLVVALLSLIVLLLGWRLAALVVRRRRQRRQSPERHARS